MEINNYVFPVGLQSLPPDDFRTGDERNQGQAIVYQTRPTEEPVIRIANDTDTGRLT